MFLVRSFIIVFVAVASALAQSTVIPQVAAGNGWKSTFRFYNGGAATINVSLKFYNSAGQRMALPVRISGITQFTTEIGSVPLPSKRILIVDTDWTGQLYQGWAVAAGGSVQATVRRSAPGVPDMDATVNMTTCSQRLVVPFDNTRGNGTGVALVNNSSAENTLIVSFFDASGTKRGEVLQTMGPMAQDVFTLQDRYSVTRDASGTMEVFVVKKTSAAATSICGIGLSFNPSGGFSTTLLSTATY
jgi:hypothetical protein